MKIITEIQLSPEELEVNSRSAKTQIKNTQNTYARIPQKFPGAQRVLDYGAGMGLGSDALRRAYPVVESYEPYPENWASSTPPTYGAGEAIPGGYDLIVNMYVLNVVPLAIRERIVQHIWDLLAPGGRALLVSRAWAGDIDTAVTRRDGEEPKSAYVQKGDTWTYQKGYDGQELRQFVSSVLPQAQVGPGGIGTTSVVVTKSQ